MRSNATEICVFPTPTRKSRKSESNDIPASEYKENYTLTQFVFGFYSGAG